LEGECDRQFGITSLFAKVKVEFSQQEVRTAGDSDEQGEPGDANPVFIAAAERGLKSALQSGELGFPVLDVQAVIVGATADPERSNEAVAVRSGRQRCGAKALKNNIVLLEPIMKLVVTVPDEFFGNVLSDLSSRRAAIERTESNGRYSEVEAHVPLAKNVRLCRQSAQSQSGPGGLVDGNRFGMHPRRTTCSSHLRIRIIEFSRHRHSAPDVSIDQSSIKRPGICSKSCPVSSLPKRRLVQHDGAILRSFFPIRRNVERSDSYRAIASSEKDRISQREREADGFRHLVVGPRKLITLFSPCAVWCTSRFIFALRPK